MVWHMLFEIRITSDLSQSFPWDHTLYTRPFGSIEMYTTLSIGSSGIHRVVIFVGTKDIQIYIFAEGV
jgi:hypothetical protein